jgi:hypothetical protein
MSEFHEATENHGDGEDEEDKQSTPLGLTNAHDSAFRPASW